MQYLSEKRENNVKKKERIRQTYKALIICARTSGSKLIQVGVK